MISGISQTPPGVAWALGFFMALALKRGRIAKILDQILPGENIDE